MLERDTKVIGYFAYASPEAVVCSGKACVIAGSEAAMLQYIAEESGSKKGHTVRKTRFGEIMQGLSLGGAYAFDEESYGRFLPLGKAEGLALRDARFSKHKKRFFTVALKLL